MDNLAKDAKKAMEAGMSYGRWKATQPIVHKLPRKIPKGYRLGVCKECGKEFITNHPEKIFCDDYCRIRGGNRDWKKYKGKEG